VAHDLTNEIDNFARYLPAINPPFAEFVVSNHEGRAGMKPRDLNFLDPRSNLWTYPWCMASGGQFAYTKQPNCITRRNPHSCLTFGDSGGFQLGEGTLREQKDWEQHAHEPETIARLYRASPIKERMLGWMLGNCDVATTIDIPLWAPLKKKSPFRQCDYKLLTEMTVENLRYISNHRYAIGSCEFMNVLQGNNIEEEDYWYEKVKDFEFEGWAIGGSVGPGLDLCRVIRRVLILRDDGMLGGRRRWFHILGIAQLPQAVIFTAIQRAVQACTGSPEFTVTFDAATPLQQAQAYRNYVVPPLLLHDIETWIFQTAKFPENPAKPFPKGSPLSGQLTVADMNKKRGSETFDMFSRMALTSHNIYVHIRGFIGANKIAFVKQRAPPELDDIIGAIGDLFAAECWSSMLNKIDTPRLLQRARLR
jgi:hypothetical protein